MPALHSATPLLLDASCVISLYASSQMEPILGVYPAQIGVVDVVRTGEMLDVWDGPDENVRQHTKSASITASATFSRSASPDNVACWYIMTLQ